MTPPIKKFTYYKGTTMRWAEQFVDIVQGQTQPANLEKPNGQTFLAEIRYNAMSKKVLATIPNEAFVLGYSDEQNPQIKDELSFEVSGELFLDIPPVECEMDIFIYYESGGVLQRDCLIVVPIEFIENVTKKDFS